MQACTYEPSMDLFCAKPPRLSRLVSRHHEAARFESKIGLAHIYVELGGLPS
jgi:hypothetical protein